MSASVPAHSGGSAAAFSRAAWALRALFFALGFLNGSWGVHVPSAKAHHGLDEGLLALALLAAAAGSVLCLSRAGQLVQRLGAARAVLVAAVVGSSALAGLLWVQGLAPLLALLFVYGASSALFDVAINADAAWLEEQGGRKVMSGFHGLWSLGGMAGAGLGALLLRAGLAPRWQLLLVGLIVVGLVCLARRRLMPHQAVAEPAAAAGDATAPAPRAWGGLLVLGALGLSGMLAEGVVYDWSVLWLQQDRGLSPAAAALGYAGFAAAMAAVRFVGDAMRQRWAAPRLMAASAWLGAAAMAAGLLWPQPWVAVVALAVLGAGLANLVPMVFMAASRLPGIAPARGIATVSALAYVGFLAGPPLIGAVAAQLSLSAALWCVVGALLLQALGARRLPR